MTAQQKLLQMQDARREHMAKCGGSVTSGTADYAEAMRLAKRENFWRRMCTPHPFR